MKNYPALLLTMILSIALPSITHSKSVTIHAVGDILLHHKLQRIGLANGFIQIWRNVNQFIKQADIAYANLEGPVAENINRRGQTVPNPGNWQQIYTSFPMFNYHPSLIPALKQTGFDVVSTANNHSLDRFALGIDKTISELNKNKLAFMGTKKRATSATWYTVTTKNNIKIAWISCTQDTNGIKDRYHQVLYCYKKNHKKKIISLIHELKQKVDALIITPHWGLEYQHKPSKQQKNMAKRWLDAGASIIIGSHPHVIQPIEKYKTKDGRIGVIAYSMGNFVSNQGSLKNRSSGVLAITLNKSSHQTKVGKIKFYPTYMQNRGGKLSLEWVTSKKHPSYLLLNRIITKQYLELNHF